MILLFLLTLSAPCMAQEFTPPKPCVAQEQPHVPKPRRFHFDTGWMARAHWTATAFDFSTTGYADRTCHSLPGYPPGYLDQHCEEENPLLWPFIGHHFNPPWRLALTFAAESSVVSLIPNKKLRRVVQIALIGSHAFFGGRNLYRWH